MLTANQIKDAGLESLAPVFQSALQTRAEVIRNCNKVSKRFDDYVKQLEKRMSQLLGGSFTTNTIDNSTYYIVACESGKKYALKILQSNSTCFMQHTICLKPTSEECERTAKRIFTKGSDSHE